MMQRVGPKLIILAIGFWQIGVIKNARAQAINAEISPQSSNLEKHRNSFWSFGLTGFRNKWKSGSKNEVIGNSAAISLGFGSIKDTSLSIFSLDIHQGPFQPAIEGEFDLDFEGTGLSYFLAVSAQGSDLRSPLGSYGFALTLQYADIVGRSTGLNRKQHIEDNGLPTEPSDEDLGKPFAQRQNYVMRVNNLSIAPGLFFAWLEKPRTTARDPKNLMTRVEGYILTLSASFPLQVTYRSRYEEKILVKGKNPEAPDEYSVNKELRNESGNLGGFSLLINFTTLLGI